MNEWYMVEYQIAQSETSRAPHFAWGLLKKKLDQSDRQELHAAISCHAFCSTAWLYPLFCTYPCQQFQLNSTQCSTSCGKCAQLNCPHTHRHSHIRTCIQILIHTHTITMIISWLHDLITNVPQKPPFSGSSSRKLLPHPDLFSHPANQTFSLLRKESYSCKWCNYWQQICLQLNRKVAEAQRKPANWDYPPWPLASSNCPSLNLWRWPCHYHQE